MLVYSICISAILDEPHATLFDQIDFAPGTTPLLPEVGDEICFANDDRLFSMTVEKRHFSYGPLRNQEMELNVTLSGEAIVLEEFERQ